MTKTETTVPPTASICDRCGAHWGFEECSPACWEAARREGLELVAGGAETLMVRYKSERDEAVSLLRSALVVLESVAETHGYDTEIGVVPNTRSFLARVEGDQ